MLTCAEFCTSEVSLTVISHSYANLLAANMLVIYNIDEYKHIKTSQFNDPLTIGYGKNDDRFKTFEFQQNK